MDVTLARVRIRPFPRYDAGCRGMVPIPSAGSEMSPDTNIRKANSAIRLEVFNSGSKNTPPRNGRKILSIIQEENPTFLRCWSVEISGEEEKFMNPLRGTLNNLWFFQHLNRISEGIGNID